tara:strand:- start:92 stop:559 length:468 start_codon:yes stop_codon:yes gene_type:complete
MSVEDLIPYVPGQSGNPAGRPKGLKDGIAACARRLLAKDLGYAEIIDKLKKKGFDMTDRRASNVIATVAVAKALTGDTKAIELLNKYEEDAPIGLGGNEKPVVNITMVQAENREQLASSRKEVTINGVSFPINMKRNGGNGHIPKNGKGGSRTVE